MTFLLYKNKMRKIKILNKKGALGEGILMIYRLALVVLIAFVVLGLSAVFYDYYINIRNVEAQILEKQVMNCLVPNGILDFDSFPKDDKGQPKPELLDYCKIKNTGRFYVEVEFRKLDSLKDFYSYSLGEKGDFNDIAVMFKLYQGDKGKFWTLEASQNENAAEETTKYKPGYFYNRYPIYVLSQGKRIPGGLFTRALVSHEF